MSTNLQSNYSTTGSYNYESIVFNHQRTKAPKYLEGFEISLARYLARRYILSPAMDDDTNHDTELTMDNVLARVFSGRRKGMLDVKSVLRQEYTEIDAADAAYAADPEKYPTGLTEHGLPSEFRCNYIQYNRHRFERCSCKISPECSDKQFCKRHVGEDNKYASQYEAQLMDLESDDDQDSDSG